MAIGVRRPWASWKGIQFAVDLVSFLWVCFGARFELDYLCFLGCGAVSVLAQNAALLSVANCIKL
jgi:hypothetical protein